MRLYRGGEEPQSGGLQQNSAIIKVTQNIAKSMAYIKLGGDFSKVHVTASTSQPVAFDGHLSICGHLKGLRNKSQKSRPVNF